VLSESLVLLGNRLRILNEHAYILHEKQWLSVNISLGATLCKETDTMESLLKRADSLLYESKSQGRNRLTLG
jgi:diguanylate cyclase (GGDEF)-like protein